jgi:protein-L-isoaspartate(D-aspartate) O-methyltransferase
MKDARRACYAGSVILDPLRRGRRPAETIEALRQRLVEEIVAEVAETSRYLGKDALDPRVIEALATVPRHRFVPPELEHLAYDNGPLPIGHGQTISQPYIVAVMTDMLAPRPGDVVLEIGTGCGYQAAVLAGLVKQVYSIEYVPELATSAAERLARLGYGNVEVRAGDGWQGWPEHAPYDGIIVTAAASRVPEALVAQLKPGRRLVVPVGEAGAYQELLVVEKSLAGETHQRVTLPVAFVPMLGG